jgi:hypothetical protein
VFGGGAAVGVLVGSEELDPGSALFGVVGTIEAAVDAGALNSAFVEAVEEASCCCSFDDDDDDDDDALVYESGLGPGEEGVRVVESDESFVILFAVGDSAASDCGRDVECLGERSEHAVEAIQIGTAIANFAHRDYNVARLVEY